MLDPPRYRSVRSAIAADVGRIITMTAWGAAAFAPVELAITAVRYSGPIPALTALRLAALTLTLSIWLWLLLALAGSALVIVARAAVAVTARRAPLGRGWFAPSPMIDGVRPGVPKIWALIATGLLLAAVMQQMSYWVIIHKQERTLDGVWIGVAMLPLVALGAPLARWFHVGFVKLARLTSRVLRGANPLARWRAFGITIAVATGGLIAILWRVLPASRSEIETNGRHVIAALVIALGMGMGARAHARRATRPRSARRRRDRRIGLAIAGAAWALMTMTLWKWGGDIEAKYVATTASPTMSTLIDTIRYVNDFDRDGYGSLLGENDCAPFDSSINPDAKEMPGDTIDRNCDGHVFSLADITAPDGPTMPVPPAFKRDWNVLFITIDATRYDSTTFGGSMDLPKHRDTTPNLAELVKKSTSFTFCNAPAAGTMASIPAIITSKYFHDGIALGEERPGMPPKVLPENTTLPEIMKRAGYHTGVIASHEYWNDWGLDQGVDDYDNSIGKIPDPFRVAADKVTDHILAWVSRQHDKWFMWAHYIDPHGRYVAHPDVVDWDGTEPDRYDAELKWTDQEVGRLLRELTRMGVANDTLLIITSDHGDSMGEHDVPVGTHGTALYRELQHVPLIFYVPGNKPHLIGGAVSNLDIVPTIVDILGIDVHDLSFEGRSLVPAIFYGKEDHDRVVFAETNAPSKERAAISERWKLIHYFNTNLDELFDLKADPWEHNNLAPKKPPELATMKQVLDTWLERVMFSRDPKFNQLMRQVADVRLTAAPTPQVAVQGQTIDDGHIEVTGLGTPDNAKLAAGAKSDVFVYLTAHARTEMTLKFQLIAWPVDSADAPAAPIPGNAQRIGPRITADGQFPSDRWRPGEWVRERFSLKIPPDWHGSALAFGLVAINAPNARQTATGPAAPNDAAVMLLGTLPFAGAPAAGAGAGSGSSVSPKP